MIWMDYIALIKSSFPDVKKFPLPGGIEYDEHGLTIDEIDRYCREWKRGGWFRPSAPELHDGSWMCADMARDLVQHIRRDRAESGIATPVFYANGRFHADFRDAYKAGQPHSLVGFMSGKGIFALYDPQIERIISGLTIDGVEML